MIKYKYISNIYTSNYQVLLKHEDMQFKHVIINYTLLCTSYIVKGIKSCVSISLCQLIYVI